MELTPREKDKLVHLHGPRCSPSGAWPGAMVLKSGMFAVAAMGDPNASIPGKGRWHAEAVLRGPPEVTA